MRRRSYTDSHSPSQCILETQVAARGGLTSNHTCSVAQTTAHKRKRRSQNEQSTDNRPIGHRRRRTLFSQLPKNQCCVGLAQNPCKIVKRVSGVFRLPTIHSRACPQRVVSWVAGQFKSTDLFAISTARLVPKGSAEWTALSEIREERGQIRTLNFCGVLHPARFVLDVLTRVRPATNEMSCLGLP